MARSSRFAFGEPVTVSLLPDWIRQIEPQSPEDACFFAGAALSAVHPVARSNHPLGRLWRQRLALRATVRLITAGGCTEDEAALRDACYLRRLEDDPGPASRVLLAWRSLTEPAKINLPDTAAHLADLLEVRASDELTSILATATAPGQGTWSAISAATAIIAVSLASNSGDRNLALWLADIVLAHSLNWPAPVPLLALCIRFADLKDAPHEPRALLTAISSAYARAAANAIDLHCELASRARKLLAVARKLRSRHVPTTINLLLREDALPADLPIDEGKTGNSLAIQQLFDRLVELGAVRELTGRTTHQLYGL